jgi:hypothetical protein
VRLEGLGKLKKKSILSVLEPATFGLVTWFLNQLRYCVQKKEEKIIIGLQG